MERDYYIYAYYEPRSPEPFYLGKGHGNRARSHLCPTNWKRTPFYNKLKKMLDSGIQPDIRILHGGISEQCAFELEQDYIASYGRRCFGTGCLLNVSDGGEGSSGRECTVATREKISRTKTGQPSTKRVPIVGKILGIIVEKYESLAHAEEAGHLKSKICLCLSGKRRKHHGIEWERDLSNTIV